MKNTVILAASALALTVAAAPSVKAAESTKKLSDFEILKTYAEDFESDPALKEAVTFAVKSGNAFFTVDASPASKNGPANVSVRKGKPAAPAFFYTFDAGYLKKLYAGDLNILTGMAKAFSTDLAPMDIDVMEGYQPTDDFGDTVVPFTFHFWTKGLPEIVPFSADKTRVTHGTNAGIFYYQPGLRSGWFDIRPGDHVNEDEKSRDNPFPSMVILTEGSVTAIIDGARSTFSAGNMMFIPAGVSHEFINEGDKPAFGFLFMFGDGA
ncbi:cupin domain-containing protein [Hyphococcus sp.]|uniref:cupin domain-containing protein n=1 Tax=Hyphococcus sp. TaxID=2038636 RepID=UPI002085AFB2|nr:MAG: hypothetical protein DHS20C04_13770 [Marinicaulis sp.]